MSCKDDLGNDEVKLPQPVELSRLMTICDGLSMSMARGPRHLLAALLFGP